MNPIHMKTSFFEVSRHDGTVVRCLFETPAVASNGPLVIIVPPFAKTMRELLVTSLYLVRNGFRTWRFDFSNHVGVSEGDILNFTLSSAIEDVRAILDMARQQFADSAIGIVSSSLGSRIALRALKGRTDVSGLVSLVGVVNLQHTLCAILGEDLIHDLLSGELISGTREVLGYDISTNFIHDAVINNLHSLESTKVDILNCGFPITNISAEHDAWTLLAEARNIFLGPETEDLRELFILAGASHKLENNPSAARDALRQAVKTLKNCVGDDSSQTDIVCPGFLDIVEKNRREREWEESWPVPSTANTNESSSNTFPESVAVP